MKNFTRSVGPTRRGERRQAAALEYFELFFDHNAWNLILAMTNLNAQRKRAAGTDGGYPASRGPSIFLDKSGRGRDLSRKIEGPLLAG